MGRFTGLSGIKSNQGGLYFLPGDYLIEIDEVKMIQTRKKQDAFVISGIVKESTNPERVAGCKPSQVMVLREDILETIFSNIKQFAGAVASMPDPDSYVPEDGQDVDEFWDETLEYMVSDDQPMKGVVIKLNCTLVKTKAGGDFTKHVWGPVVEPEGA